MPVSILALSPQEQIIAALIHVLWQHGLVTLQESARQNVQLPLLFSLLIITQADVFDSVLEI
jgi:hypothetical protein